MTKDEAIKLFDSKVWEDWSDYERAYFQLHERKLCMPFELFHKAVEATLGRPVWTHEFGLNWEGLIKELEGKKEKPSIEQIINLIPEDKRIIVVGTEDDKK